MWKSIKEGFEMAKIRGFLSGDLSGISRHANEIDPVRAKVFVGAAEKTVGFWPYLPEGVGEIIVNDLIVLRRPKEEGERIEEELARWTLEDLKEYIESERWLPLARKVIKSKK